MNFGDNMKDKVKKVIEEEKINPNKTYQNPFLVLLTGNVGSGKSLVSQLLSKELNLYLVSGDYIRNIIKKISPEIDLHREEVRKINNEVCLEEIKYCIKNRYSIILDRSISSKKSLSTTTENVNLPIIFIKLISSEEENIKRVINRQEKQDIIIPHYGHQETKSGVVTEEEYNEIKERKVYDLEDSVYSYFINTNTSLEELKTALNSIIDDIKEKYKNN